MYTSKWVTYGCSAILELAAGASYAFSLYAPALKAALQLDQAQVQAVANALLPSLALGLLPGVAYDALQRHNRAGPRLALLIGALVHLLGYAGLWAAGTRVIAHVPYRGVVALGAVAMSGAAWTDVACVSAAVRSFPRDRGTAIGLLKAMMGLSASVYTAVYAVTLRPHALSFLLVIALGLPLLTLLAAPVFNAVPFRQPGELPEPGRRWSNRGRFAAAYGVVGVLSAAMLAAAGLLGGPVSPLQRALVLAGIAAVLLPLLLLWPGSSGFWARPGAGADGGQAAQPLLEPESAAAAPPPGSPAGPELPKLRWQRELRPAEALRQLDFWLLYFVFGASAACGLLFLANVGQVVESRRGAPDSQDPLLALFSVLSCLGRLLFGFLPERALHTRGTPRTWFLVLAAALMAAATLLSATAGLALLRLAAPVTGLAYGAQWSLMPALTSELFGLRHFGLNYVLVSSAATAASYLLSNLLGGYMYQRALQRHGDAGGICLGSDCFRTTFLVAAGLEVAAVGAALLLSVRTRGVFAAECSDIRQEEEAVLRSPLTGHRLLPRRLSRERAPEAL